MTLDKISINTLDNLFDYYKIKLFNSELPQCLVNLSMHKNTNGFFIPKAFNNSVSNFSAYQISISPKEIELPNIELHSILVHNMVHLHQEIDGTAPFSQGYHNKKWANAMVEIGLQPFNIDDPTKATGNVVSQNVIKNGPFENAYNEIKEHCAILFPKGIQEQNVVHEDLRIFRTNRDLVVRNVKYCCGCDNAINGKPGLNIICSDCGQKFQNLKMKPL